MSTHFDELIEKFHQTGRQLEENEHRVLQVFRERGQVSRDTNREFESELTFGEKLADSVAAFVGSWTFIVLSLSILLCWIGINIYLLAHLGKTFDPYPFILLNLMLSMVAALQAPLIMMSQNRQAAKDRLDAAHDYEVNLKAELEIMALNDKVDNLREAQWNQLLEMQKEQMKLLAMLCERHHNAGTSE